MPTEDMMGRAKQFMLGRRTKSYYELRTNSKHNIPKKGTRISMKRVLAQIRDRLQMFRTPEPDNIEIEHPAGAHYPRRFWNIEDFRFSNRPVPDEAILFEYPLAPGQSEAWRDEVPGPFRVIYPQDDPDNFEVINHNPPWPNPGNENRFVKSKYFPRRSRGYYALLEGDHPA